MVVGAEVFGCLDQRLGVWIGVSVLDVWVFGTGTAFGCLDQRLGVWISGGFLCLCIYQLQMCIDR